MSFGTKECGTTCGLKRKKLFSLGNVNLKTQFVLTSYSIASGMPDLFEIYASKSSLPVLFKFVKRKHLYMNTQLIVWEKYT